MLSFPQLHNTPAKTEDLKTVVQGSYDAYYAFMKTHQKEFFPDYSAFVQAVAPYYTNANYTKWVNPAHITAWIENPNLHLVQNGGMSDYDPEGWGSGYLSLYEDFYAEQSFSRSGWYANIHVQDVSPVLLGDRFAQVKVTLIGGSLTGGAPDPLQSRVSVLVFLRKDGGSWRMSGYGHETVVETRQQPNWFAPSLSQP